MTTSPIIDTYRVTDGGEPTPARVHQPSPPSANVTQHQVDKRFGVIKPPEFVVPEFPSEYLHQLQALGLSSDEIEALRHEVDRDAGQGVTAVGRGAEAVRRATQRRKEAQKARLTAAEDAALEAQARSRFDALGLPAPPNYPGAIGLVLVREFAVWRGSVCSRFGELILAEREYEEARKAAGKHDGHVTRDDLQRAFAGLEMARARAEVAIEEYTASIEFFADPDRRAKAADLAALLETVNMSAFEQSLIPFIQDAGEHFDKFSAVCKRIQTHVTEHENQLARARMLARQIGLKPEAGILPDSRYANYSDVAFRAVSNRVRRRWVDPFLAGNRRGFGEKL